MNKKIKLVSICSVFICLCGYSQSTVIYPPAQIYTQPAAVVVRQTVPVQTVVVQQPVQTQTVVVQQPAQSQTVVVPQTQQTVYVQPSQPQTIIVPEQSTTNVLIGSIAPIIRAITPLVTDCPPRRPYYYHHHNYRPAPPKPRAVHCAPKPLPMQQRPQPPRR